MVANKQSEAGSTRTKRAFAIKRREMLRFLASLGIVAPTASLLSAVDGALNTASAQTAPRGPVPKLTVFSPNFPDHIEMWRQLTRAWGTLGIELDIRQGTLDTWSAQVIAEHRAPHLTSMTWGGAPDRIDPDYFISELFLGRRDVKGGLNYGHYHNDEFDKVAEAQRSEMDVPKRQKLVREAQAHLAKDNPSIILFHRDTIHAYNKARFGGMKPILGNGIGLPFMPMSYMDITPLTGRKFIKVAQITDINSLNPFLSPEVYNSGMMRQIYATFVTRDERAELMPWALASWNVVDSKTVDIVLRPGTKFHDGKPATVEDVKFTFDFILRWRFPALRRVTDSVESATITGDNTVRLALKTSYAPFVANVLGYAFLVPKHVWEKVPDNLKSPADWPNDKPVGSGPWKLVEWKKGEFLNLASNQDFFMKPKLDGFVALPVPQMESMVGMLERGDVDMVAWNLDATTGNRIAKNPDLAVVRTPTHGIHEIRLNLAMAPLDNPAFRLALQHATDRAKLLDILFSGAGVASNGVPITPVLQGWSNPDIKPPEPNLDRARDVLKGAGFTWDGNGRLQFPGG